MENHWHNLHGHSDNMNYLQLWPTVAKIASTHHQFSHSRYIPMYSKPIESAHRIGLGLCTNTSICTAQISQQAVTVARPPVQYIECKIHTI